MKKFILICLSILVMTSIASASPIRDVNAIAMDALQKGLISDPNISHDFTKIPQGAKYRQDAILVRFAQKPDGKQRNEQEKNQVISSLGGGNIKRNYDIVPGLTLIELPKELTIERALLIYNVSKEIIYAEPDYEVTITTTPNDTYFSYLWGMNQNEIHDHDIDAPEAWDYATGSSDIIVAVIDTGIRFNHSDLAGNMWINEAEYNGSSNVDDDNNGYVDDIYGYDFCHNDGSPMDDNGHGTHCAGTIGAVGNNSTGVTGVCWDVSLMALKFLDYTGNGYDSDAIECIEYAIMMGADIMSNSWGTNSYNQSLKNAIDSAESADILFVAAAGNDSLNTDVYPHYPSCYDCDNIISVLATNSYGNLCSFSNYGSTSVDLGAPGEDIYSCSNTGGYCYMNGTSMAAPHVSGACALLLSITPNLTYEQVKDLILDNVEESVPLLSKCVTEGRLNLNNSVNGIFGAEAYFLGIESSEDGTIWIDKYGNLFVTGTFTANTSCSQTGYDGMKVYNSGGSSGIAVVDSDAGNMKISGSCYENQNNLTPPSGSRLIIKDNSGNVLAYLTNTGNLYLKGVVYDDF